MKMCYGLFAGMLMNVTNRLRYFPDNKKQDELIAAFKERPLDLDNNKFSYGVKSEDFVVFTNDENPDCNKLIVTTVTYGTVTTTVYIAFQKTDLQMNYLNEMKNFKKMFGSDPTWNF